MTQKTFKCKNLSGMRQIKNSYKDHKEIAELCGISITQKAKKQGDIWEIEVQFESEKDHCFFSLAHNCL